MHRQIMEIISRIKTEIRKIVKWFGQKLCTVKNYDEIKNIYIGIIWVFLFKLVTYFL